MKRQWHGSLVGPSADAGNRRGAWRRMFLSAPAAAASRGGAVKEHGEPIVNYLWLACVLPQQNPKRRGAT